MAKVTIESINSNDGEGYDVVLRMGKVRVQCLGVDFVDDDEDALGDAFEEWLEMAEAGEEGFALL